MAQEPRTCTLCGKPVEGQAASDPSGLCTQCQSEETRSDIEQSAAAASLVGQTLGDIEILELLHDGQTATVYKARQPALNRPVAVKVLPRELAADPALVELFRCEARAAAAVRHPNIVDLFATGQADGLPYMVMELVDGESLADALQREGRLRAQQALPLMKQVAAALAEAHAAGLVHRDIQPANILVSRTGTAKLADFGLATCPGMERRPREAGSPPGAPPYFPPEAARGRPLDARADLYLFGATFYHLLAGHPPFEADNPVDLALKHLREDPPPLNTAAPHTPLSLCHLIHLLLRRKPGDRLQSAGQVLVALEGIGAELSAARVQRREDALAAVGAPIVERAWGRLLALVSGLAALVVLAFVYGVSRGVSRGVGTLPPQQAEPQQAEPAAVQQPPPPEGPGLRPGVSAETPQAEPGQTLPPLAQDWETAWAEADALARRLVREDRYGLAIARYAALESQAVEPALRDQAAKARADLLRQAEAAWARLEARARKLAEDKDFAGARALLEPALKTFGVEAIETRAKALLRSLDEAEQAAAEQARLAEEGAARQAELARLREADARYKKALEPVEARVRALDLRGTAAALAELSFPETRLADRLEMRRHEIDRLAALKARMIAKIKGNKPSLRKSSILIPGLNGDLVEADEHAITALLPGNVKETHLWTDLGERAVRNLALLTIDRDSGEDWVALGILALTFDATDQARQDFGRARALGVVIGQRFDPLAERAFEVAKSLLAQGKLEETLAALDGFAETYGDTPWFRLHRGEIDLARQGAAAGLMEREAERLYAEAVEELKRKHPEAVRRLVEDLRARCPGSRIFTDAGREVPFSKLAEVADMVGPPGTFLTVRQDGAARFRTIQEAIDAAQAGATIEVRDSAVYAEALVIPEEKEGLSLKGGQDCWPVVLGGPASNSPEVLVDVRAPRVSLSRLILAEGAPGAPIKGGRTLRVRKGRCGLGSVVVYNAAHSSGPPGGPAGTSLQTDAGVELGAEACVFVGPTQTDGPSTFDGCAWLAGDACSSGGLFQCQNGLMLRDTVHDDRGILQKCTVLGYAIFRKEPGVVTDSVLAGVDSATERTHISYCNLYGANPIGHFAQPGEGCTFTKPQFVDPRKLDFRLVRGRGKASDGGEIGCRFTPQMLEMLRLARNLSGRRVIDF